MKKIFVLLLVFLLVFAMNSTAFAGLVPGTATSAEIPIEADFSAQAITFTVSESVTAETSADDPTVLVFSGPKFVIENTMTMGYLAITEMTAKGVEGWQVVADNTYPDWKAVAFNQNQISILAEADGKMTKTDLSGNGFTGAIDLKYGTKIEFDLSGHTGAVSRPVNTNVARIITTVSLETI